MSKFRFGKSSRRNMEGVRHELVVLVFRVLAKSDCDFGIPMYGGKRRVEDQQELYSIGRTTQMNRKPVTWVDGIEKESYHQTGNALDIFVYHNHEKGGRKIACWNCTHIYDDIADIFKSEFLLMKEEGWFKEDEELVWGGDWSEKKKDRPHFQISKTKSEN